MAMPAAATTESRRVAVRQSIVLMCIRARSLSLEELLRMAFGQAHA
jgi:hypothetical protein